MDTITIIQIVGIIIWMIYFLMEFIRWWNKRKEKVQQEIISRKEIFINISDIDFSNIKSDPATPNIITELALKENAKGYKITVTTNSIQNDSRTKD